MMRIWVACACAAGALALPAMASANLVDPGFEAAAPSTSWTTPDRPLDPCGSGVCLTGDDGVNSPLAGAAMTRLGGPFRSDQDPQPAGDQNTLRQQRFQIPSGPFTIDYDLFTYEVSGQRNDKHGPRDALDRFTITVSDKDDNVLAEKELRATGYNGGTQQFGEPDPSRKSTGWRAATFDFTGTGAAGQPGKFEISVKGGDDNRRGTWAYADFASSAPGSPVSVAAHDDPASGVTVNNTTDGEPVFLIDNHNQFQKPCAIPSFSATVSGAHDDAHFLFVADNGATMAFDPNGSGNAPNEFFCVEGSGELFVAYRDASSQRQVVPIARVSSMDRAGYIYDRITFDQLMHLPNASAPEARAGAAIGGATVRLQRSNATGGWEPVVADAPGVNPPLNAETTNADGHYQWTLPPLPFGQHYRAVVSAPGFDDTTTAPFDGGGTIRDLDVAMEPSNQPPPPAPEPPLVIYNFKPGDFGPDIPQAPPPTDRAFAGVGFATRIPVSKKGVATFTLRCPAGERACKGEIHGKTAVTVPRDAGRRARRKAGRQLSLRPIPFRLDGPGQATVRAKLSRKIFARLKKTGRLAVDLAIDAQDGAGNLTTTKAEVTFTYGKRKRKA